MTKNVRKHSYHQFYPVLAKIRINRGLLYYQFLSLLQLHYCKAYSTFYNRFIALHGLNCLFRLHLSY